MLGGLFAVLCFARRQRGFRQGLGVLQRRADGLQQAQAVDGLPAAIGLWKPAIVLPADFDARYSSEQRALMVAHERMHIVRGDLHANALTAALRCVFWFNPLLHLAARHFRHDQELACDLRVIARHPHARRAYGEAMLKTQLALHPLPLGCYWGSHPLKERIAMLKQPVPSLTRWIGGVVLVGTLAFGVAFAAWSSQPARDSAMTQASMQLIDVRMRFVVDGKVVSTPEVISSSGRPFSVSDGRFLLAMAATTREDGSIGLAGNPSWNGHRMGEIKVTLSEGKPETFRFPAWQVDGERRPELALIVDASTAPTRVVLPTPPPPPMPPAPPAPPTSAPPAPPSAPAIPAVAPVTPAAPPPPELPAPAYPKDALAQNVSGKVVLEIDVDAKGNPVTVNVVESEPAGVFDASAVDAAKAWKFNPVPGRIRVPIRFEATPINETKGVPMGPSNPGAAAYDWIKLDPAVDKDIREQNCDVIYAQSQGGANYCGRLRKPTRQG
jgi:TonB family protein